MEVAKIMVSVFSNVKEKNHPESCGLMDILESMKTGLAFIKKVVTDIRKEKDHGLKNILKVSLLPVFCPSGLFLKMKDKGIDKMSGVICIDLDNVSDIKSENERLMKNEYVFSIFKSPSGEGLKVLVLHNLNSPDLFNKLYAHVGDILGLQNRTDLVFDLHCSNISRPCFWSYDPNLYINPNPTVLNVDNVDFSKYVIPPKEKKEKKSQKEKKTTGITASSIIQPDKIKKKILHVHELFEKYYNMYPGVRNRNLFILAGFFCNSGIPEDYAIDYLITYYTDTDNKFMGNEIITTVQSAYKDDEDEEE